MTNDEKNLLNRFYNFCMDECDGLLKEENIHLFEQSECPHWTSDLIKSEHNKNRIECSKCGKEWS
jgi:ribosomal protein S27AE